MALKDIKAKIGATNRTHKVTRAMEAVSAAKMRKTQAAALAGRPYARAALQILARLSDSADLARHPLTQSRPVTRTALVVITSDKGLAGALNSGVIKAAHETLSSAPERTPAHVDIYAYGKKGEEYFRRRGFTIRQAFENKKDEVERSVMEDLVAELSTRYTEGECDEVIVAYSNFKSTFEQAPTVRRLLPLSLESVSGLLDDIALAKGAEPGRKEAAAPSAGSYTIEPPDADILSALLPRLASVTLYHMLLEAKASEHSARMVAMKSASDKSEEMAHALTRLANKLRQAAITREVSEIVGGREALAV